MNDTDWAATEDSENSPPYGDLPRKRHPMPAPPADANDFLMGAPEPEEDDGPPLVRAKYDGRCSACEEFHILEGITMIRSDGCGGWEAEECAW